ncbi:autism susceptibility gene 2 protein isoform X3 [Silurus meridionalis]|uniref:autism susceptibility gene 2 protein isoform X3 n=1 Tax=Silurus meridionalis TaxID=175797 RepID=UPI001EEB2E02|nr:autism susceptibility gene 2 protein isoform X3 [Silurus meridionalis]
MDGPSRSGGLRQSRRSRSQRDRERRRRRADIGASSPSSGSEQERCRDSLLGASGGECRPGFPGVRQRPPRRRKRESVSCEEDIIDGFAIASFISLEALEMDCSLKPPERAGMLMGRGSKRKRGLDENGGPLTEPEEGPPATYTTSSWEKRRNEKKKRDSKVSGNLMETGYICDAESESGDKASDNDMEPTFVVSTREVSSNQVSIASTVSNGCALLPSNSGPPRLSVTPRVSGLERSQERSLELPYPEATTTSSSLLLPRSPATVSTSLAEQNGNAAPHHRRDCSPPQHKPKQFLPFSSRSQNHFGMANNNRNGTSVKTPPSSTSSSSIRPPTPSTSVPAGRGPSGVLRPSSHPSPSALFTPPPGLPPPPPLLQVSPRSSADPELLRQELNPHFLEGRASGNSAGVNATSASGGSSVSSSSGTSSRAVQGQPSIPPMAYQFHQHNHQHQHTHTHQHFLHPPAPAPPMFEKFTGKIDGLFRHQFFPQYPPPVPGIQPVLPPTGPFSSLQGAFQPKGPAPDMPARLGVVPPHLQPKDPRITDPFAPSLKVSNKPGKWCAMHVRVAWMILRHQEKVKLMQADPQKLELRNDLPPRLPGSGGIGGIGNLGALGGPLPPTHDLTRPGSLFAAASGVNPSSTSFIPPSTPHSSFLTPATHLDPYGRSPPFPPLGALGAGAFGGLGSPSLGASSVFGHKAEPSASAVGGLGNPHDPWNRIHVAPPYPSGPSWAKGLEKRDDRDRGKDMGGRELTQIKDEKDRYDRDSLLYGRQPVRMSPGAAKHRSSTPSSHMNGLGPLNIVAAQSDVQNRDRERERERDRESDKRHHSSSRVPASTSSAPDRPRSSTSSVLATPPPNAPSASSPLDLFGRQTHALNSEPSHPAQRESSGPASSSSSVSSLPVKKPDRTTTPVSKPPTSLPPGLLHPPVKVKEERKEEPEPVPISLTHPSVPTHSFERPNSRHTHHPSTPSSTLSLTPTSGVPLPPPTPHPTHHHLPLLDRSRLTLEAYLSGAGGPAGLVVGPPVDRFAAHPHTPPQGHSQAPHSFPWDPWRELAAQQQQQQRREILAQRSDPHLALRTDPHLSRLLQHQHARYLEAERAAAVAAAVAVGPHHQVGPTPTSSASSSATRPEFALMTPFDRPHQVGGHGGGMLDEDQRTSMFRDFERVRYFGMHSHLSTAHLPSPSHAAHLDLDLLSHTQLHPPGGATPSHHPSLYSRLGPLHPHSHVPNGMLTKPPSLVPPLSVGAPPPLIPSATRSSTPPRSSRLGGAGDLAMFSSHKDGESR